MVATALSRGDEGFPPSPCVPLTSRTPSPREEWSTQTQTSKDTDLSDRVNSFSQEDPVSGLRGQQVGPRGSSRGPKGTSSISSVTAPSHSPAATPPRVSPAPPLPPSGPGAGRGGLEGVSQAEGAPPTAPTNGTFSETVILSSQASGPPSLEVDASASTAFSGIMGHTNAISSDERSSNGRAGSPSSAGQSDGALPPAAPPGDGERLPFIHGDSLPQRVVCQTKTVNQPNYDIPKPETSQASTDEASPIVAGQEAYSSFNASPSSRTTYPVEPPAKAGDRVTKSSLSSAAPPQPRRGGWALPPGGGLRGGAPLPGETSAISNGTTGWGPPPSSSTGGGQSTSGGGWGSAPPANPGAVSAWGSPQGGSGGPANSTGSERIGGPTQPDGGHYNISFPDDGPNNNKMLNMPQASSSQQQQQQQPGPLGPQGAPQGAPQGPGPVQGSTSWAAAAGKGLPPSEPASSQPANGTTNKQLEQLNSVREALFSQDGWGGQNVKQDTSWDVGATQPDPPTAPSMPKADSMQWQAPSPSRNDGTDLWRSTLSGVPQPPKPQPATPWGNHTPAHPADYKNWGEDEGANSGEGTGGVSSNQQTMPPPPPQNIGGMDGAPGMWNQRDGGNPSNGPSGPGPVGASQPAWDQDRQAAERAQFEERNRQSEWGGVKPKEDAIGWNNPSSNNWGPGGGPGGDPRSREPSNGGAGWGPPPATKPAGGPGGGPAGWGAGGPHAPQQPPRAPQWENDSPTISRRFDDGGTSIWGGGKGASQGAGGGLSGPPGGWKDMPIPNIGTRGPPGGPGGRMPPGPGGMKPNEPSPWGQPQGGRGWDGGDTGGMGAGGTGWGMNDADKGRGGWNEDAGGWNGNRKQQMPGALRSSPSWEEPGGGMPGGMPGAGGDNRWGGPRPGAVSKDMIWGSKPFRILCDMGYRKEDVETALRQTDLRMDDALEMLNALTRGPGRGMHPGPGGDMFGPRGGEPDYMRFPGPGPMPYPPGDIPPANPSLHNLSSNPSRPGSINMNPMMNGAGPGGPGGPGGLQGPPRLQQNGPPSTSRLRVLVQQIQMAVQAGHLNPQILNQPLAPQTLLLLNQLLQQIKQLQNCQQQHAMAHAAGQRPGAPSSQALLGLTVQITKHKQQINNLQNQITAQQAQYLKNQQPQPPGGGGGHGNAGPSDELNIGLANVNITDPPQSGSGDSKVLRILRDKNETDFARAPGSSKAVTSQSSPNLLLDSNSPWSNGSSGNTGWPEAANDKPVNTSNSTDEDNFGIPEFVPGKAWKGAALKDPSEDPTLTPGSVAPTPINAQSEKSVGGPTTTTVENSLGLTPSTWSFNTSSPKDSGAGIPAPPKDSWGGLPASSSSNNLSGMGQDLWGQNRAQSNKQPTPTSGWPTSNGSGWSNGVGGSMTNTSTGNVMTTTGQGVGNIGQQPATSSWLILRNLTAQIDGSTLRTLCMQHGPLHNFHLYLTHGIALVKYGNGQEAKKAQNALNNCVLGNTTILAETTGEQDVEGIVRNLSQGGQSSSQQQQPTNNGPAPRGSTPATGFESGYNSLAKSRSGDTWSALGSGGLGSGVSLGWPSPAGLGGSVWGAPDSDQHRTTPLNSFLPPDLLSEGI